MSDNADRAQQLSELALQHALARRLSSPGLKADGSCHNCGGEVLDGALFCDQHCRTDYEKRQRARTRTAA